MITEADLNNLITSNVVAVALVGRPPKPEDDLVMNIAGQDERVNIADIYLIFENGAVTLQAEQLALPVGAISAEARASSKPVISTPRTNTVTDLGGGGPQIN